MFMAKKLKKRASRCSEREYLISRGADLDCSYCAVEMRVLDLVWTENKQDYFAVLVCDCGLIAVVSNQPGLVAVGAAWVKAIYGVLDLH